MTIREYIAESSFFGGIADECAAIKAINAARRLLWTLDDWVGTISYGCVSIKDGCFYLPRHIETARYIWECDKNVPLRDEIWYHLDCNDLGDYAAGRGYSAVVSTDIWNALPVTIPYKEQIGFAINDETDAGKEINVTIKNQSGSVRTQKLTLPELGKSIFADDGVLEIISINKAKTNGSISILTRAGSDECRIYVLEADEVNPRYRLYRAPCACSHVVVKGKKKFFPYNEGDMDRILDLDPSGISFAINALEHKKNKEYDQYAATLKLARAHLERAKEDLGQKQSASKPSKWYPASVNSGSYGY